MSREICGRWGPAPWSGGRDPPCVPNNFAFLLLDTLFYAKFCQLCVRRCERKLGEVKNEAPGLTGPVCIIVTHLVTLN